MTTSRTTIYRAVTASFPLTTIFSPPPACTQAPLVIATGGNSDTSPNPYNPVFTRSYDEALYSACFPPAPFPSTLTEADGNTVHVAFFTDTVCVPGVCPSSYLPVATSTSVAASSNGQPATYSLSFCCPMGMTWMGSGYSCASTVAGSTFYSVNSTAYSTVNHTNLNSAITVAWRDSDRTSFVPPSAPLTVSAAYASATRTVTATDLALPQTSSSSSTASSTSSSGPSSKSPKLSAGAQAGIGVGVSIAGLMLGVVLAMQVLRRKRSRRDLFDKPIQDVNTPPQELNGGHGPALVEADFGGQINEVSGVGRAAELESGGKFEFDGSQV